MKPPRRQGGFLVFGLDHAINRDVLILLETPFRFLMASTRAHVHGALMLGCQLDALSRAHRARRDVGAVAEAVAPGGKISGQPDSQQVTLADEQTGVLDGGHLTLTYAAVWVIATAAC